MEAFLRGSRSADSPLFKRLPGAVALLYTLVLGLTLGPLASVSPAQGPLLPVFRFQGVEGIPTGQMRSRTVRDREGFIWFGMLYGLVRFDGASVREYLHDPGDRFSIPNNYVTALLVDRRGRIWAGTANHGVCVYDAARDRFVRVPLDPADSAYYRAKSVEVLLEDRAGNIWIGSYGGGIVRLDGEFLRRDLLGDSVADLRSVAVPLPTPRNTATDLLELDDGRLLAGSDRGLWLVDTATLGVSPATSGPGTGIRPDTALVARVRRDSRGSFWVGTGSQGLLKLDRALAPVAAYTHRAIQRRFPPRGSWMSPKIPPASSG